MKKIKVVSVEPLKMGRVRSTGEIRAAYCRVSVEYENGRKVQHHINTRKGGIYMAYQLASDLVLQNMKERGIL